jgi:hypothetical protein
MSNLIRSVIALAILAECASAQIQPVRFCFPDTPGVHICPCNNPPMNPGLSGCNNFGITNGTGGARLDGTGDASVAHDTLYIEAYNENHNVFSLLLESRNAVFGGLVYGAGVRCVTSPIHRVFGHLGYRQCSGPGYVSWGLGTDPGIGADIGALIGETTYFQAWYRDPNAFVPCQNLGATFNVTNAVSVTWSP